MPVSRNWRNLRDFLRKSYNREVNEWFRDIEDPLPDNSTSRKNAKRACLILPTESQNTALLKALTFRFVVQRVHLRPDIYGMPIGGIDSIRVYRPQIQFFFQEDEIDTEPGFDRVEGRISYRLMNQTSETISLSELRTIANRIKTEFGTGRGYVWRKGKTLYSYTDKLNGYQLQILGRNESDAKELITKVLATNSDTPDWINLSIKDAENPTRAYPTMPLRKNILGTGERQQRKRPIADVRFQYTVARLHGKNNPVVLIDRSGRYYNPLVT